MWRQRSYGYPWVLSLNRGYGGPAPNPSFAAPLPFGGFGPIVGMCKTVDAILADIARGLWSEQLTTIGCGSLSQLSIVHRGHTHFSPERRGVP